MKKFKCLVCILLITAVCISFVGCNKTATTDGEELISVKWFGYPKNPRANEGSFPEKYLEDKFNIEITPYFVDSSSYLQKKSLLMASGEELDIIYELDPIHVQQDVSHGLLAEISRQKIEEIAPNATALLNKEEPKGWLYSNVEDKNYGLPNISYDNRPTAGLYRTDWLKNVGIDKIPETLDELHTALYKFTYEDPDGNGKDDTYGMSGTISQWFLMFPDIFGAHGVLPFNWMEVDGKPVYGGLLPEVTETLVVLKKWYEEGLIHPDYIIDSGHDREKFLNGVIGFHSTAGTYFNETSPNSLPNKLKQLNPEATIGVARSVEGYSGDRFTHFWGKAAHVISFGKHLEKDMAKLERLLKMIDVLASDEEIHVTATRGIKGQHWDFVDNNLKYEGGLKFLEPYTDNNKANAECIDLSLSGLDFFVPVNMEYEIIKKHSSILEMEFLDKYRNHEFGKTDLFLKADVLPSSSKYLSDLQAKQINYMVQVISGGKPVSFYEGFYDLWQSHGGNILTKEAYDLYQKLK